MKPYELVQEVGEYIHVLCLYRHDSPFLTFSNKYVIFIDQTKVGGFPIVFVFVFIMQVHC